jgi:hypothetical protein
MNKSLLRLHSVFSFPYFQDAVIFRHDRYTKCSLLFKIKSFCAMCQAASSSWLAEAREVRSLTSKVKDLEAKLGPLEVHIKNKDSEENVEISNISNALDEAHVNKDSQERMGTLNLVNASREAESPS